MVRKLSAIVFDMDGSVVPQGGWMDPRVAAIFRGLEALGIPMGPATGKNADYARGIATGIGRKAWDFIIAETGGIFLELIEAGPPPAFKQHQLSDMKDDLSEFCQIIRLDQFRRRFRLDYLGGGRWTEYRPELKETILTMFPPSADVSVTERWASEFRKIIEACEPKLSLVVQRHSDGAVDILPSGVSKKLGVQKVCQLLKCDPDNILTVVDGINDYELAEDTTAIAVANAVKPIKDLVERQGGFIADDRDGLGQDGLGFAQGLLHFALLGAFGEDSGEIVAIIREYLPELRSKSFKG